MRRRVQLVAAVVFLLLSVAAAAVGLSGAVLPPPPFYPTNTPRPTPIADTPAPTQAPARTAEPSLPDARYLIGVRGTASLTTLEALITAVDEALEGSPLQAETSVVLLPDEAMADVILTAVRGAGGRLEITISTAQPPPPPLRVDQGAAPWPLPAANIPLEPGDDIVLAGGLAVALLELNEGFLPVERVEALRRQALNSPQTLPASTFAHLDFLVGRLAVAQGELRRGLETYSQALRRTPELTAAVGNRGGLYLQLGDPLAALAAFDAVLAATPEQPVALYNRALAHLVTGDMNAALDDVEALLTLTAGTPEAYTLRGYIHYQQEAYEAALADFQTADDLQPEQVHVVLNIARTYDALGQPEQALEAYRWLTQAVRGDAQLYIYQGVAYRAAGDPVGAVRAFNAATRAEGNNPVPYIQRAEIALEAGDLEDALAEAQAALEREPTAGAAHFVVGEVYLLRAEWRPARDAYTDAIENGTVTAAAYAGRGWAQQNLFGVFSAAADYEEALALGASDPLLFYRLGFALYDIGRYEDALEAFQGAFNGGLTEPEVYAILAVALDANFRRDEADATYLAALEQDPRLGDGAYLRDLPLWSTGAVARARTILQRLDQQAGQ